MSAARVPRMTKQRAAVSKALGESSDFISAQDLHERLRAAGEGIGLATVYRNLQAMATSGEVDVVLDEGGTARYRQCSTGHHHHLVCRECGKTVEVEGAAVESWTHEVAEKHGFVDISHTIEIYGVCSAHRVG